MKLAKLMFFALAAVLVITQWNGIASAASAAAIDADADAALGDAGRRGHAVRGGGGRSGGGAYSWWIAAIDERGSSKRHEAVITGVDETVENPGLVEGDYLFSLEARTLDELETAFRASKEAQQIVWPVLMEKLCKDDHVNATVDATEDEETLEV